MMQSLERHCIVCGEEVKESMGFVLARDVLDFLKGKREGMREICAKDGALMHFVTYFEGVSIREYLESSLGLEHYRKACEGS
jgi:hypothetical protein